MPRVVYLLLGFLFVALGFVGAFLPLLPTVPFLLLALWCFARSSQKFHDWLYTHPRWGPPLQHWDRYGVVPLRAKLASCSMMALSMAVILWTTALHPVAYIAIAAGLIAVGIWITTRPGTAPADGPDETFPPFQNRP